MSRKMLRIFVVAFATLTFAGSAQAAGLRARSLEAPGLATIWESIAGWLRTVLVPVSSNDTTNPDEGSSMDPNGR